MTRDSKLGFSLIELLITLAIIAILTSIALPTYSNYTKKAYFSELVQGALPYKLGVEACYQLQGALAGCDGGQFDIPPNQNQVSGGIARVSVLNGVITLVPLEKHGFTQADTYVLMPHEQEGRIIWVSRGGGVEAGYAA